MNKSNGLQPSLEPRPEDSPQSGLAVGTKSQISAPLEPFDQPVILQQPRFWSRAIAWALMGVTTAVVTWAFIAQIDEAVPAQGKLEPEGTVAELQAPTGGVVKEILVKDGQRVKKGEVLLRLDPTAAKAQLLSLRKIRTTLSQENEFYRSEMQGIAYDQNKALAAVPIEQLSLTRNRAALLAENQLYRAQLSGIGGGGLTSDQQIRLQAIQSESGSRINAAELEVNQLQRQLQQAEEQLASAKTLLPVDQKILDDLRPLVEEGGIQRVQFERQKQQVITRQSDVQRFSQEVKRLQYAIAQSNARVQNAMSVSQTDLLTRMSENDKRVAEIDSQLTKLIVDNQNRITESDSQISQTEQTLRYQDITAPTSGTVFDLKAGLGYVTNSANAAQPVLKIVPDDALIAKVFITNKDIGFVREGLDVDVRVDSFPFSEFGDIKGQLISIGSDALPPDQIYNYYRFPAKIRMQRQYLSINGRQIPLQSGMSISGNIKLRKRSVASIFTDLFTNKIESVKTVR